MYCSDRADRVLRFGVALDRATNNDSSESTTTETTETTDVTVTTERTVTTEPPDSPETTDVPQPLGEPVQVSGPVSGGAGIATAARQDLAGAGYVEQEFLFEGDAAAYRAGPTSTR
jgi:Alpha/beta hydrolase domain